MSRREGGSRQGRGWGGEWGGAGGRGVSNALILLAANLKQNEAQSTHAEPTPKGVNWRSKYVTHVQQDVPLVECMYLVFTHMPGESYHRRVRSLLLYLCYVFLSAN